MAKLGTKFYHGAFKPMKVAPITAICYTELHETLWDHVENY